MHAENADAEQRQEVSGDEKDKRAKRATKPGRDAATARPLEVGAAQGARGVRSRN